MADSHLLELEMSLRDDIKSLLQIKEPTPGTGAIASGNPELIAAIEKFLEAGYRSEFYNIAYDRYFDRSPKYETGWGESGAVERLSPTMKSSANWPKAIDSIGAWPLNSN